MLATTNMANMVAMVCMVRTSLIITAAPDEQRLAQPERVARIWRSILSHVGTTPHVESIQVVQECCSRVLQMFEAELFPESP